METTNNGWNENHHIEIALVIEKRRFVMIIQFFMLDNIFMHEEN